MPNPDLTGAASNDGLWTGLAHAATALFSAASTLIGSAWIRKGRQSESDKKVDRLLIVVTEIKSSMATQ